MIAVTLAALQRSVVRGRPTALALRSFSMSARRLEATTEGRQSSLLSSSPTPPDQVVHLDGINEAIIGCLRLNARESAASIAESVKLSPSAVRRRIAHLETAGVITGYAVSLDHDKMGSSLEAYIELSFEGGTDVHAYLVAALEHDEVREAMTIAGEPDAIVRVRVASLFALRELAMELRRSLPLTETRTRVILGRFWHGASSRGG